jgi:hypothetical protein
MAISKEDLYKLIDKIQDERELEFIYTTVLSIVEDDDQSWYWTEQWQKGEKEANEDITYGKISEEYGSGTELIRDILKKVDGDPKNETRSN